MLDSFFTSMLLSLSTKSCIMMWNQDQRAIQIYKYTINIKIYS